LHERAHLVRRSFFGRRSFSFRKPPPLDFTPSHFARGDAGRFRHTRQFRRRGVWRERHGASSTPDANRIGVADEWIPSSSFARRTRGRRGKDSKLTHCRVVRPSSSSSSSGDFGFAIALSRVGRGSDTLFISSTKMQGLFPSTKMRMTDSDLRSPISVFRRISNQHRQPTGARGNGGKTQG